MVLQTALQIDWAMDAHRGHEGLKKFIGVQGHGCDDIAQAQEVEPESVVNASFLADDADFSNKKK